MATIAKNFRVKNGLVVEGTVATVNGNDILTNSTEDQDYITSLVGGSGESDNVADTLVLRDANGDFAANEITAASVVLGGSDLATTLSDNDTAAQGYANDAETGAVATAAADATSKANAAQSAAEATAASDATTKADAAQSAAEATAAADATSKANAALASAQTYADTAEADAISSANSYTDGRETAITTAYEAYADQAETDAVSTAAADATSKANTAESNANSYTDSEISALIGGAPELLNTLDEIAAAIADDDNFSTTVVSDIAQGLTDAKAYTDTRETAITTAYQSYADTAEADAISTAAADATAKADAAQSAAEATAASDATSKANAAQSAAEATAAADATTKANTAESNANTYTDGEITTVNGTIDALTTDDIAEGTNEYYTTTRAKTDAAALLVGATKTNIEITGDENGLTITAENGVADSTTDDLAEGSNLYFTDQRAVDALEAVTPVFTEVDVNSIALNVASTVDVATQNTTGTVYSFDSATYTSAKFVVKADTGSHTEVTEVLLTLDSSSNIAITEYALVNTGGSLMEVSATMSGTDVQLQATVVNDATTVSATGTLIV